jgi:superfamily II DNA/RNA helicase
MRLSRVVIRRYSVLTPAEEHYRALVFTKTPFTDVKPNVSDASLRAIKEIGFPCMTRVQALAIPAALGGKDVLISARTGHGKTLAFGIPLFEALLKETSGAQG